MTYYCKLCSKPIAASGRVDHLLEAHPSDGWMFPRDSESQFTRDDPESDRRGPIPMILHCPECRARHVDKGAFTTKPHHTHSCQTCGFTWRPAVIDTVGVQFLPGFRDRVAPEWERLCKGCAINLQDAEFHEAHERGCEVCGTTAGMVMNDYLVVRAPGADEVRKRRTDTGIPVLQPGEFYEKRGGAQSL